MSWRKLGLVFEPKKEYYWMVSHASAPVASWVRNDIYRVYFASRDERNRSHIGYIEIDLNEPWSILKLSKEPVLAPGPLGYFDDHGVYASSIVRYDEKLYLYYIGWNPGVPPPLFYSSIGLAISSDEGISFDRASKAPILARSEYDPCLVTAPCVMVDGRLWRMWYVSGLGWQETAMGLKSYYHIKYAESQDGLNWKREGHAAIDLHENETNIGRASVLKNGDIYEMWYSYVADGQGYRIGFARSRDGVSWHRLDNTVNLSASAAGWDSEAMAYPYVFVHKNRKYMFYNGNGFGRTGFGLAIEE